MQERTSFGGADAAVVGAGGAGRKLDAGRAWRAGAGRLQAGGGSTRL